MERETEPKPGRQGQDLLCPPLARGESDGYLGQTGVLKVLGEFWVLYLHWAKEEAETEQVTPQIRGSGVYLGGGRQAWAAFAVLLFGGFQEASGRGCFPEPP